jgi:uncharacterized protein YndB with AHSA1/START domain
VKRSGNLIVTVPSDREIVLTRAFDAPRRLVFGAMTKPELLKRWLLGPPGWSMVLCEVDLNVGAEFRYLWRNSNGAEMGMRGLYREIAPPERIVNTACFDFGCEPQSGEQLTTTILTEERGQTTLTCTVLYPSEQARDATIASGMAQGVAFSYDRLAELLPSTVAQL